MINLILILYLIYFIIHTFAIVNLYKQIDVIKKIVVDHIRQDTDDYCDLKRRIHNLEEELKKGKKHEKSN